MCVRLFYTHPDFCASLAELALCPKFGWQHNQYLLMREEKYLSLRAFDAKIALMDYEQQMSVCSKCGKTFKFAEMEAAHIIPWSKGGKTTIENCQMLCRHDNRVKSGK